MALATSALVLTRMSVLLVSTTAMKMPFVRTSSLVSPVRAKLGTRMKAQPARSELFARSFQPFAEAQLTLTKTVKMTVT
jgi:hypothetical protein